MPALGCEGAYETRGEAFGGRFGNGHPAVLLCEAAQLGEHDGFSIAALSHDEHEAARSAGAVVERLLEVLDDILSPNENRGILPAVGLKGFMDAPPRSVACCVAPLAPILHYLHSFYTVTYHGVTVRKRKLLPAP